MVPIPTRPSRAAGGASLLEFRRSRLLRAITLRRACVTGGGGEEPLMDDDKWFEQLAVFGGRSRFPLPEHELELLRRAARRARGSTQGQKVRVSRAIETLNDIDALGFELTRKP